MGMGPPASVSGAAALKCLWHLLRAPFRFPPLFVRFAPCRGSPPQRGASTFAFGRPETDAGGPIMFTQPQPDSQPSFPSTNPPSPVPPGPVPAPAPRQAGDIPAPPLNSAGSSGNKGGTVFEIVTDRIIA